jgi:hypothetical protein
MALVLGGALLSAPPSKAASITFGPFPDFKGFLGNGTVTIPTLLPITPPLLIPGDGVIPPLFIRDRITVRVNVIPLPIPIFAATYVTADFTIGAVGPPPNLRLTDVYALDLNPSGNPNDIHVTGFNPLQPEITPLSAEQFIGELRNHLHSRCKCVEHTRYSRNTPARI